MDTALEKMSLAATREIFLEALDVPASMRRDFLQRTCSGNAQLRIRVEELLAEHERLDGFLGVPAARPAGHMEAAEPRVGEQIGRYRLLEQIGEGGAGLVFMAEQSQPVRRRVALKVLKLGMDTRQVVARFEAERQALAMMDHPNIATVFDGGATESGRPYFVMELVRGPQITTYCDQHRLPMKARIALFSQVCRAIQHAHQKGVIHRDIKPSNILVTEAEGGAVPKVIDFGIAKAIEQPLTDKTLFTEFRALIGTPAYMSPEQLDMAGSDVDTRSDIYSLGVLLYEMLTGQTPFGARALWQSGVDEFRRTVREVEPERPSARITRLPTAQLTTTAAQRGLDDRALERTLRGELDWIVMKCLEKDRGRRYATVNDLAADIQRFLKGEPVLARAPTAGYRVRKFLRRHRLAVGASVVVAVSLVLASAVSFRQAALARKAEKAATEAKVRAEAESERAQQNEARALLNEYAADVTLAQQALAAGNFGRAHALLSKHAPAAGKADLRGFEWGYLSKLAEGDPHEVLIPAGESVRAVAFSPDGQFIAVGAREKATILNASDRSFFCASTGAVFSVAFAPDSSRVYLADPFTIRAVNLHDRSTTMLTRDAGSPIALSTDGRWLAGVNREGVRIFETSSWSAKRLYFHASGPLAFSNDGSHLLTADRTGFSLQSLIEDRDAFEIPGVNSYGFFHQSAKMAVFSWDDSRIFAASDRIVKVLDSKTGAPLGTIPAGGNPVHSSAISAIAISPDGKTLATASWDHSIELWNSADFSHIRSLKGHLNEVWAIAFSPDGRTLLSGAKDGGVFLWPMESSAHSAFIAGDWQPIGFSQDEKTIAAINRRNGSVATIDVESGVVQSPGAENYAAPSRQNPFLARASGSRTLDVIARRVGDSEIEIADRASGRRTLLQQSGQTILSAIVSPDGKFVGTVTWGGAASLHELEKGGAISLPARGEQILFTSDSKRLLLVARDGAVTVWNARSREVEKTFTLEMPPGFACALSPDDRLLATAAAPDLSNTILLTDIRDGTAVATLAGHKQGIHSLAFTPDGKTLASASGDGSLKLWNIPTLQEILTFPAQANNLFFSPHSRYLGYNTRHNGAEGLEILRSEIR